MASRSNEPFYEAITHDIRVRVTPSYEQEQSAPEDGRYFWAYRVELKNLGRETVQLKSRYWRITDANGRIEEVRGPGVVGEEPVLAPGQSFTYTSGCPLRTSSGIMVGCYQMQGADGAQFNIEIPAFSLDSPFVRARMN